MSDEVPYASSIDRSSFSVFDKETKKHRRGSSDRVRQPGAFVIRKPRWRHLFEWRVDAWMARSNQPAVARVRGNARRNAPETRRARVPMSRVDGPPRARRLARARDSNARDIRRGAGISFSFVTPRVAKYLKESATTRDAPGRCARP